MSITKNEKKRLIMFISNMKQTGQTAYEALNYFSEKMTSNKELKVVVDRIANAARKGFEIEEQLHKEKIIDDLQYAILRNSKDKNVAYENVVSYTAKASEADKFYVTNFIKIAIMWVIFFYGMIYLIDLYSDLVRQLKEIKPDFQLASYIALALNSKEIMYVLLIATIITLVIGVFFYKYSYHNMLSLHYKIFKLKAIDDGYLYLKMISDMLKSEVETTAIAFNVLSRYMYPLSCRPILTTVEKKLINNADVSNELKTLGIIDDAIFTIKTARMMKDIAGGFKNAFDVTDRYLFAQKAREEYIETLKFIVFVALNAPLGFLILFMTLTSIEISF